MHSSNLKSLDPSPLTFHSGFCRHAGGDGGSVSGGGVPDLAAGRRQPVVPAALHHSLPPAQASGRAQGHHQRQGEVAADAAEQIVLMCSMVVTRPVFVLVFF